MRLRVTLTMATPILGPHIPSLKSLIEWGCCIREGDDGLVTAERILPTGGTFQPDYPRRGSGGIGVAAKITQEYGKLDPDIIKDALKKGNQKVINKRPLVIENHLNFYTWYNHPSITAEGEGDPDEVAKVLRRIDSIGVRRKVGWGWIEHREVVAC